jgi:cell wall assembly regulator SMI1
VTNDALSPPLTEQLLEQLGERWRREKAAIADQLKPGLCDSDIDRLAEPLGLLVPTEARTWWRWHNGAGKAFIVMDGGKAFWSLQDALAHAALMRRIAYDVTQPYHLSDADADAMARTVWDWDWLPLCNDGVGGGLVIDAGADQRVDVSPVLYRDRDSGSSASPLAPSLGALVSRWIEVLDTGAATWNLAARRWHLTPALLPTDFDDRAL